jgi:hypothetical protein
MATVEVAQSMTMGKPFAALLGMPQAWGGEGGELASKGDHFRQR